MRFNSYYRFIMGSSLILLSTFFPIGYQSWINDFPFIIWMSGLIVQFTNNGPRLGHIFPISPYFGLILVIITSILIITALITTILISLKIKRKYVKPIVYLFVIFSLISLIVVLTFIISIHYPTYGFYIFLIGLIFTLSGCKAYKSY